MTRNRWFWLAIFIAVVTLLTALGTAWNFTLLEVRQKIPWVGITLGSFGFLLSVAAIYWLFLRLWREMKVNQLQTEFLARVTHELKTPLGSLKLSSSLIRDPLTTPDEHYKLWKVFDDELSRLSTGIESLLLASQESAIGLRPKTKWIHLETLLRNMFPKWKALLGEKGHLERVGNALDIKVKIDPMLFDLILSNLVSNSAKFAIQDPHLTIRTQMGSRGISGADWSIEFMDRGWGFNPRDHKKIFKRFTRLDYKAPYAVPGTGLGLYLAKSAAKALGVKISATSEGPGKGSSFLLEGHGEFVQDKNL